jgi:hypothetical protein
VRCAYSQVTRHAVSASTWPAMHSSTLASANPSMPVLADTRSSAGSAEPAMSGRQLRGDLHRGWRWRTPRRSSSWVTHGSRNSSAVGRRVLVEEPETARRAAAPCGCGERTASSTPAQPLLELGQQALHDADEELGPSFGEVVVQEALRHAGGAGDLGLPDSA